VWMYQRPCP